MTAPPDRIWAWDGYNEERRCGVPGWSDDARDGKCYEAAEYVLLDGPTMQATVAAAEARGREQGLRDAAAMMHRIGWPSITARVDAILAMIPDPEENPDAPDE